MNCCICSDDGLIQCNCGKCYCVLCGLEQGTYNQTFDSCVNCRFLFIEALKKDIPKGWEEFFNEHMELLEKIQNNIKKRQESLLKDGLDATVYPSVNDMFNAFRYCSPQDIKVVIQGQDVYHGEGQAMGLSFSVRKGVKPPPSLKNIFSELQNDGFTVDDASCGDLTKWAKQGIFLYNSALTVEKGKAGSHLPLWKNFSENVIKYINTKCEKIVFILWGSPSQKIGKLITNPRHHIISTAHPSPLSAHRGFFGSKVFSKTNNLLDKPIDWSL